jgi:hypothetical protein
MCEAIEQNDDYVLWYCGQNYTCYERTANGEWLLISQEAELGKQYIAEEIWRMKGADTNCMVHRREILETVGGWDEQCRWGEDWDLFCVFLWRSQTKSNGFRIFWLSIGKFSEQVRTAFVRKRVRMLKKKLNFDSISWKMEVSSRFCRFQKLRQESRRFVIDAS